MLEFLIALSVRCGESFKSKSRSSVSSSPILPEGSIEISSEVNTLSSFATLFLILTVPLASLRFIVSNSLISRKRERFSAIFAFVIFPSFILKSPSATRFFFIFSGRVPDPFNVRLKERRPKTVSCALGNREFTTSSAWSESRLLDRLYLYPGFEISTTLVKSNFPFPAFAVISVIFNLLFVNWYLV